MPGEQLESPLERFRVRPIRHALIGLVPVKNGHDTAANDERRRDGDGVGRERGKGRPRAAWGERCQNPRTHGVADDAGVFVRQCEIVGIVDGGSESNRPQTAKAAVAHHEDGGARALARGAGNQRIERFGEGAGVIDGANRLHEPLEFRVMAGHETGLAFGVVCLRLFDGLGRSLFGSVRRSLLRLLDGLRRSLFGSMHRSLPRFLNGAGHRLFRFLGGLGADVIGVLRRLHPGLLGLFVDARLELPDLLGAFLAEAAFGVGRGLAASFVDGGAQGSVQLCLNGLEVPIEVVSNSVAQGFERSGELFRNIHALRLTTRRLECSALYDKCNPYNQLSDDPGPRCRIGGTSFLGAIRLRRG